jgi:hypothetical protein
LDDFLDIPYWLAPDHFLDFIHVQGLVFNQCVGKLFGETEIKKMVSTDATAMSM